MYPKKAAILILFYLFGTLAKEEKLPDNGRLEVGKCLQDYLRQHPDSNIQEGTRVEDFLEGFCTKTREDPLRVEQIYDDIRKEGLEKLKFEECFESPNRADELFSRYENASQEVISDLEKKIKPQIISAFTRTAVGICLEKDLVKHYKNLNEEDQEKTFNCLQSCAVRLFTFIEDLIKKEIAALEKYEKRLPRRQNMQNKDQRNANEDDEGEIGEDSRPGEKFERDDASNFQENRENFSQKSTQERDPIKEENEEEKSQDDQTMFPEHEKIPFEEKAHGFVAECNKRKVNTIDKMTDTGEEWLKEYDQLFEQIYKRYRDPPFKYRVANTLGNYLNCDKWICAMANHHDRPFRKWIEDENAKIYVYPLAQRLFDWG